MKRYWLVKQEPSAYSWDQFVTDGKTSWTGVRNYTARNNLRAMGVRDQVLYYHSTIGKECVGIAEVSKAAYPDPTATDGDWSAVDLIPKKALKKPVPLEQIKKRKSLKDVSLLRLSRLSVHSLTAAEYREILLLSKPQVVRSTSRP